MLPEILSVFGFVCFGTATSHNPGYCGPYQAYGFQNPQQTTSAWFRPHAINLQQKPLGSWLNTKWTTQQHRPTKFLEPHIVVPHRAPPAPWFRKQSISPTPPLPSTTRFRPRRISAQETPSFTHLQSQRLRPEKNSTISQLQAHKISPQQQPPTPWLQPQTINPQNRSWLRPQGMNSQITPKISIPSKPRVEPKNVSPQTPPVTRNPNPPPTDLFPQSQRTLPSQSDLDSQGTSLQQKPTELSEPEPCLSTNMEEGVCQPFSKCEPWVTRLLENPQNSRTRDKILLSNALCDNKYAVVCCPLQKKVKRTEIQLNLPTIQDGCGYQERLDAFVPGIVGGEPSELGAWPWIALIGYSGGSKSPFKCGGTLITSRHVLTAAHCVKLSLSFVRLGEHDLSTDKETRHIDVPVSKVLKHPQFDKINGHNDIAMLLLDRTVELTDKIGTICLPLAPELQENPSFPQRPYVAGWGRTMEGGQPANTLQQLQITVFNNSDCKDSYEKENKLISQKQFDDSVVCAGDISGGKDTCQGDSGGPLMDMDVPGFKYRFHLIGIISYGIGCARPNTPGVYTNVVHFIDWIKNAVNTIHL